MRSMAAYRTADESFAKDITIQELEEQINLLQGQVKTLEEYKTKVEKDKREERSAWLRLGGVVSIPTLVGVIYPHIGTTTAIGVITSSVITMLFLIVSLTAGES